MRRGQRLRDLRPSDDPFCLNVAGDALVDVRLRSAEVLMTFPLLLDKTSKECKKGAIVARVP